MNEIPDLRRDMPERLLVSSSSEDTAKTFLYEARRRPSPDTKSPNPLILTSQPPELRYLVNTVLQQSEWTIKVTKNKKGRSKYFKSIIKEETLLPTLKKQND